MKNCLPLISTSAETEVIAYYDGHAVYRDTFLSHVEQARKLLPARECCINLCENRYHFLVVFAACASMSQVSLLPNSRADKEIERIRNTYKDNYLVDESTIESICKEAVEEQGVSRDVYQIDKEKTVAIVFTSGSTGVPKANPKTWEQLVDSAQRVKERLGINRQTQHSMVATVPPQHMFGFETTIIYPLIAGVAIHAGRPFYPLDIQQALNDMPSPRILVSTPVHLKACNNDENAWPDIDFVISATAPMPDSVATKAEKKLNTRVCEIYGCSETGAIATRQITEERNWQLLEGYNLSATNEITMLTAPGYSEGVVIPDNIEVSDKHYFRLLGRKSDLVNMGGKRGSLTDLAGKLKMVEGVSDAVFVMPDEENDKRVRLAAIAVAPGLNEKKLRTELAKYVDAVFLPRPLVVVKQLPYNKSGKLPRARILEMLKQYLDKTIYQETA